MNKQRVMPLIRPVYYEPTKSSLTSKMVTVSQYRNLLDEIPDEFLEIHDVFPEEDLDLINERFKPYLGEFEVFPFLGTLGDNIIAVGYGMNNEGKIYYYDTDFGLFELDSNIQDFLNGLQTKNQLG